MTFSAFPPPAIAPLKLFLDSSNKTLSPVYPEPCRKSYDVNGEGLSFSYTFAKETVLCGPIDMPLAVCLEGCPDSDIFVTFEKLTSAGIFGEQLKIPYQSYLIRGAHYLGIVAEANVLFYKGPTGHISVSRRILEKEHAVPGFRTHDMKQYNLVEGGEIVDLLPPLTQIGMRFGAGNALRVRISGTDTSVFPLIYQALTVQGVEDVNQQGTMTVHCGANGVP
jgi:uncharacterized protein